MAATFAPADAFVYIKKYVKSMPLEEINAPLLDEVQKMIWMAAPWRWTIGTLPNATLASATQDYTITTPADFLYIFDGYISDGDKVFRNLIFEPTLPTNVLVTGDPSRVAYMGSNTYRLFPKPGTLPTTPSRQMLLRYKKTAPIITNKTQFTAGFLVMDDDWFPVFNAGVLWKSYLWGDDSRAGNAQMTSEGKVQYTGQLGVFKDALREMALREKLPLLDLNDTIQVKAVNK